MTDARGEQLVPNAAEDDWQATQPIMHVNCPQSYSDMRPKRLICPTAYNDTSSAHNAPQNQHR